MTKADLQPKQNIEQKLGCEPTVNAAEVAAIFDTRGVTHVFGYLKVSVSP